MPCLPDRLPDIHAITVPLKVTQYVLIPSPSGPFPYNIPNLDRKAIYSTNWTTNPTALLAFAIEKSMLAGNGATQPESTSFTSAYCVMAAKCGSCIVF